MAVKSVPITEATAEQKRSFVVNFLNLDLPTDASDSDVESAIMRAQPGTTLIFVEEIEQPQAPAVAPPSAFEDGGAGNVPLAPEEQVGRAVGSLGKKDPRWLIELPIVDTEDNSGSRDVLVGVNGRAWQIKRGVPVNLPQRVVEALDHAVTDILRHNPDTGDDIRRSAKRHPYQIHERPTEAEIVAWREATANEFCA